MGLFLEARGEGSNTDTERGCCPASLSQLLGEGLCLSWFKVNETSLCGAPASVPQQNQTD